jgi:hypothetical protein
LKNVQEYSRTPTTSVGIVFIDKSLLIWKENLSTISEKAANTFVSFQPFSSLHGPYKQTM